MASAIRINTLEIGITDCTNAIGTEGRLTRVSVIKTGKIDPPTQASKAKNAITSNWLKMPSARRFDGESC